MDYRDNNGHKDKDSTPGIYPEDVDCEYCIFYDPFTGECPFKKRDEECEFLPIDFDLLYDEDDDYTDYTEEPYYELESFHPDECETDECEDHNKDEYPDSDFFGGDAEPYDDDWEPDDEYFREIAKYEELKWER